MRKPNIHKIFLLREIGLSNVFMRDISWEDAVNRTEIKNLYVIPAGFKPDNPAELLSLPNLKNLIDELRVEFDYIIIDTPPVDMVTDAQVISQIVDAYLLIVASGKSPRDCTLKAKKLIQYVNGRILGVVLTKIKDTPAYRCYSGYQKKKVKQKEKRVKGQPTLIINS
jgi:capsular exopolysaccharide synthesis family protein